MIVLFYVLAGEFVGPLISDKFADVLEVSRTLDEQIRAVVSAHFEEGMEAFVTASVREEAWGAGCNYTWIGARG